LADLYKFLFAPHSTKYTNICKFGCCYLSQVEPKVMMMQYAKWVVKNDKSANC